MARILRELSNFGKLLKSTIEEKRRAGQTFQTYCHSFVFNCYKLHNLFHLQAVPNPTHHTMCAAWVRRKRLALVPTYFSAQILCAFPSRNITSTTTSYCLHCLHCLHWLQCLQSTTLPPKSLQRSPAVGDFYGTGIEIWAEFGPNGQLFCLHSFKIFWPMKPSYTSKMSI